MSQEQSAHNAPGPNKPTGIEILRQQRRKERHLLMAFFLYGGLFLMLGFPLAVAISWSLVDPKVGWFAPDLYPSSLSLYHWTYVLRNPRFLERLIRSLTIAASVAVLSAILALPTAWALARFPFRLKRIVELFVLSPMIVPGILVSVSLTEMFYRMGLHGTTVGVVLVHTVGTLPLMIRVLTATLEGIPEDLFHAARTLGAKPLAVTRHIVLPLIVPGIIAGGLLNFVASFEEIDRTLLIGGVKLETVAVMLFKELGDKYLVPTTGAVITLVLLIPAVVIFFIAARLIKENVMAAGIGKL